MLERHIIAITHSLTYLKMLSPHQSPGNHSTPLPHGELSYPWLHLIDIQCGVYRQVKPMMICIQLVWLPLPVDHNDLLLPGNLNSTRVFTICNQCLTKQMSPMVIAEHHNCPHVWMFHQENSRGPTYTYGMREWEIQGHQPRRTSVTTDAHEGFGFVRFTCSSLISIVAKLSSLLNHHLTADQPILSLLPYLAR